MKKTIAILIFLIFTTFFKQIAYANEISKFSDVPANAWYKDAMLAVTATGAIDGFPDGTFKPQNNISVDQFIKIVVVATGNRIEEGSGYWAQTYIDFAMEKGFVLSGEFIDYKRPITRGEIARILVRALTDAIFMYDFSSYTAMIKDYTTIPKEYQDYILKAFISGLMTGYPDETFKQENNATRAEAVTMVHRLIDPKVRIAAKDPDNKNGYTNYIEPENLIRKVIELELAGNFQEAYKYLDSDFTKNGAFTVDDYRKQEKLHVSYKLKYFRLYYPNEQVTIHCKRIESSNDYILMAYGHFSNASVEYNSFAYGYAAKELKRKNGLWYLDITKSSLYTPNEYIFRFNEGR